MVRGERKKLARRVRDLLYKEIVQRTGSSIKEVTLHTLDYHGFPGQFSIAPFFAGISSLGFKKWDKHHLRRALVSIGTPHLCFHSIPSLHREKAIVDHTIESELPINARRKHDEKKTIDPPPQTDSKRENDEDWIEDADLRRSKRLKVVAEKSRQRESVLGKVQTSNVSHGLDESHTFNESRIPDDSQESEESLILKAKLAELAMQLLDEKRWKWKDKSEAGLREDFALNINTVSKFIATLTSQVEFELLRHLKSMGEDIFARRKSIDLALANSLPDANEMLKTIAELELELEKEKRERATMKMNLNTSDRPVSANAPDEFLALKARMVELELGLNREKAMREMAMEDIEDEGELRKQAEEALEEERRKSQYAVGAAAEWKRKSEKLQIRIQTIETARTPRNQDSDGHVSTKLSEWLKKETELRKSEQKMREQAEYAVNVWKRRYQELEDRRVPVVVKIKIEPDQILY